MRHPRAWWRQQIGIVMLEARENMRIAICDDEKEIRDFIAGKVGEQFPTAEILSFPSGEELLREEEGFELLFLDIQMPGKNGIETARELRRKNPEGLLIFITALEEYVFQSFDVGAFHYLVKPLSMEKFREVLAMAKSRLSAAKEPSEEAQRKSHCLLVKSGSEHIRVNWEDIVYAEVFNRKVMLHRKNSDTEYYGKLSALEKLAGSGFFRVHRSYLVNLQYIDKYDSAALWLENGAFVPIARQKYAEFVRQYLRYIREEEAGDGKS